MTTIEYQKKAIRTMKIDMKEDDIMFGIIGEFGEMTDVLKKMLFHSARGLEETLKKEIGDFMWYIAVYCHRNKIELSNNFEHLSGCTVQDCIYEIQFCITELIYKINNKKRIDSIMQNMQRLCVLKGLDIENVLELNIEKLRIRYPEKYSDEDSEKRIDVKGE